jgi:hypothetical protein
MSLLDSSCNRFIVESRILGTQMLGNLFTTHTELDVVYTCLLHVFPNNFSSFLGTIGKCSDAWDKCTISGSNFFTIS